MRIARFYQKTLFGVFAMIGLIVALTSALYVYTVNRQLTGDFLNNSRTIARSIADSNVDLIVHRNYSALQSIVDELVEISGISYVFVVDEKGVIIASRDYPLDKIPHCQKLHGIVRQIADEKNEKARGQLYSWAEVLSSSVTVEPGASPTGIVLKFPFPYCRVEE